MGWLSRLDLRTRPGPAGPQLAVPGAQLRGTFTAELRLLSFDDPEAVAAAAREAELPLQAVTIAGEPRVPEGLSLLALEPRTLVLSALKPADDGDAIVLRVSNPGDAMARAVVRTGFALESATPLRLDETPADFAVEVTPRSVSFDVPPHALRSIGLLASAPRGSGRNPT